MRKHFWLRPILLIIALLAHIPTIAAERDSLINEALAWRKMGNLNHALYLLSGIDASEARFELATTYYMLGKPGKAIEICRRLAADTTLLALDARVLMGQCRRAQGFDRVARRIYKRALAAGSSNAGMQMAEMYFDKGRLAEAEEYCQKAILLNTANAEAHLLLAQVNEVRGLRFQAMLPLYYYLLISNEEELKNAAYQLLVQLWCARSIYRDVVGRGRPVETSFNAKVNRQIDEWTTNDTIAAAEPQQQREMLKVFSTKLFGFLREHSATNLDFYQIVYSDFFIAIEE